MSFDQILQQYRAHATSERDKGDRFERLMQAFLKTDPTYAGQFQEVWRWAEFPYREQLGGQDTGVDLVGLTHSGAYWAVQCKFVSGHNAVDKPAVDTFLSTSGRGFRDAEGRETAFAQRLWIETSDRPWTDQANEAIRQQRPPVQRIGLRHLQEAAVDWDKLQQGLSGAASRTQRHGPRAHQLDALAAAQAHYAAHDRGKLIMACGTGKTLTALWIAEQQTQGQGLVLFLVPSIALLGQTLREWTAQASQPIQAICICSDPKVSRKEGKDADSDLTSVVDLALPASTDAQAILRQFQEIERAQQAGMTVVFSTYQSIEVIAQAQALLRERMPQRATFDLIICDEAHRTTGVTLSQQEKSAFVKVHKDESLRARKRLYMTATPRLYSDDHKLRAAQQDAVICSMDDEATYGAEFFRIGFGEAVDKGLLTDYKVLVLTMSDKDVPGIIEAIINNRGNEINTNDMAKLIGCINAMSKRVLGDQGLVRETDPGPMRRAVAFCGKISDSKKITGTLNNTGGIYRESLSLQAREDIVPIAARHIDGSMNVPTRDQLLAWLKEEQPEDAPDECRVLTNVRCLSEGVDVPSLDAVLFLSARNSEVDVVQSVGRVMRRAPGKKYGYIIIPIVIPANVEPDKALDDNERYRVVWTVLNALRAHDDRFNATVNKIDLNRQRPGQIQVVGVPGHFSDDDTASGDSHQRATAGLQLQLQFEQLQSVIYARMVQKVGDKHYWERWAKSVADIAERQVARIQGIIAREPGQRQAFDTFLRGLQENINPGIDAQQAIEMLSQHTITRPVFEALFEDYSFVQHNPISKAMQGMLDRLEEHALDKDLDTLTKFYTSVRENVGRTLGKIDNAEGRQRIVIELYDKFFKAAFPKMQKQLGIVYTPVEVVDFIVRSVEDILRQEFGRSISDEGVHVLDPFTGTGTFMTRLLQSGLIRPEDLPRKYAQELHANEIVLLAYYIAAINIEQAYHYALGTEHYVPFEGVCLTDTFQLGEIGSDEALISQVFTQNSERVQRQKRTPLRVIIGNPPYSVGQKTANDDAQNQRYPKLGSRIFETYVKHSNSGLNKSTYDSYKKAFRWSSDRIDNVGGGVIAFISNGSWIKAKSEDGFRKCIEKEFDSIYVIDLRGDQTTSGEASRREGGKLFGSSARTPIAITFLIKKAISSNKKASIHYLDIGEYLSREEKLQKIKNYGHLNNIRSLFSAIYPNVEGDWIQMRSGDFENLIPINPPEKRNPGAESFFVNYSLGISTNRDQWTYNFSSERLGANISETLVFYNDQVEAFRAQLKIDPNLKIDRFVSNNHRLIAWTVNLKKDASKFKRHEFAKSFIRTCLYRIFCKQNLYLDRCLVERPGLLDSFFPNDSSTNMIICCSPSVNDGLSLSIANCLVNLHFNGDTQCFPLYYYEERKKDQPGLFDRAGQTDYIRHDGVSDWILQQARTRYGKVVGKEDIFYYVYGFLHHPAYRETFANDLKKMLPRLPLVDSAQDFWRLSKAGRALAALHIGYEQVPPCPAVTVIDPAMADRPGGEGLTPEQALAHYRVEQLRFPKKGQKDTILYNSRIRLEGIPARAYAYVVNGKSAIEWVMERYAITTHKESGIRNDPNDWSAEQGQPRYILDLLLSVIELSLRTLDLVDGITDIRGWMPGDLSAAPTGEEVEADVLPFRPRTVEPTPAERYRRCLPLVPLQAAAGAFGEAQTLVDADWEWVEVPESAARTLEPGMFVAQVVGASMEPRIPAGSYGIFRAPVTGTRQGRILLVQLRDALDPDTGRYTVKRYRSEKAAEGDTWTHTRITLEPLNPAYAAFDLDAEAAADLQVVAEWLAVLG